MKTLTHSPAPRHQVSPQRNVASVEPIKKGLCLHCGDLFNLTKYHQNDRACPDCSEIFEGDLQPQETGAA